MLGELFRSSADGKEQNVEIDIAALSGRKAVEGSTQTNDNPVGALSGVLLKIEVYTCCFY
jgi:hypothetical protein